MLMVSLAIARVISHHGSVIVRLRESCSFLALAGGGGGTNFHAPLFVDHTNFCQDHGLSAKFCASFVQVTLAPSWQ